jgi:hypothetical protein
VFAVDVKEVFVADFGEPLGKAEYVLSDSAVARKSKNGVTEMAYADVVAVSIEAFGGIAGCTLRSRSGQQLAVIKNEKGDASAYKAFVTELHKRLASSGAPITFTRGSWFTAGVVLGIVVILAAVAFGLELITTVPQQFAGKLVVAKGLAVVGLIAGPLYAFASRPRPYDASAIPEGAFR